MDGDQLTQSMPDVAEADRPDVAEPASEITRGMVRLVKDVVGRGPVHAHTEITESVVVCLLEECMTQAERTLIAAGSADQVKQLRLHIQEAFSAPAIELVERVTGRGVRSFLSDHDVVRDIAAEVFVLAPPDVEPGPTTGAVGPRSLNGRPPDPSTNNGTGVPAS